MFATPILKEREAGFWTARYFDSPMKIQMQNLLQSVNKLVCWKNSERESLKEKKKQIR